MRIKLDDNKSVTKASTKLIMILAVGLAAGLVAGLLLSWKVAPLVAWDAGAAVFVTTTWLRISKYDSHLVRLHALREDPSRILADMVLLVASIASIAAVGVLLVASKDSGHAAGAALGLLGVVSVVASWFVVHTLYALKYAQQYYSKPQGGVDFGHDKDPTYSDFAYLAFTIGMTYQVSDTALLTKAYRATAIKHAMLSFLLGTVIIATTINLVAGLGK
jgi:uncharacterized membrane protein